MHEKPRLGRLVGYNQIGENLSTPREAQRNEECLVVIASRLDSSLLAFILL